MAAGALAIVGWTTSSRRLASIHPDFIPMAPSTALAFALLGGGVLLSASRFRGLRWVTAGMALLVLAASALQMTEFLASRPSTLDALLSPHPGRLGSLPTGWMSPVTAAGFFLAAAGLLSVLPSRARAAFGDLGGLLASLVLLLSMVMTLGYSYGTPLLYGGGVIPMALTTALSFGALACGLIALAGTNRFPLRPLSGSSAQARLLRAFLPIAPAVVIADGLVFRFLPAPNPALHAALLALVLALSVTAGVAQAAHIVGSALDRAQAEREARDRAEREVSELDGRYRMLFENNPHPMWVCDLETLRFLAANAAAVAHYGYSLEEFLGMTIRDIHPSEDAPVLPESLWEDLPMRQNAGTARHRRKDGSLIQVETLSRPVSITGRRARLVLATDITERRRLEAQLLQAQKMEAVGQLAGGIAHDFNNLLGVITGYAELLLRETPPGDDRRRRVGHIQKAAARAAELTRQLLALGRRQVLQPTIADLNSVVQETEAMLRRVIPEHIQVVTVFGAELGRVNVDLAQIEHVIINLALNARDAMPQGGRLIIETANLELDESYARSRPEVRPGPHVMLAVSDSGHGMDAATVSRIFEPFFTTKEPGKGTGLGLAMVYGIVKQSGGHVAVYSEVGHGTTFKVYLPRADGLESRPVAAPPRAELRRGCETILLAEDDQDLRAVVRETLEDAGYAVLESVSSEDALSISSRHDGPIHLLVTDVVMPRMSGRAVGSRLTGLRPDTRVLYMSGYTHEVIGHDGALAENEHFLQKPFTTEALLGKVRELLDGG